MFYEFSGDTPILKRKEKIPHGSNTDVHNVDEEKEGKEKKSVQTW